MSLRVTDWSSKCSWRTYAKVNTKQPDGVKLTFSNIDISANLSTSFGRDVVVSLRRVFEWPFVVAFLSSLCICQLCMCHFEFIEKCVIIHSFLILGESSKDAVLSVGKLVKTQKLVYSCFIDLISCPIDCGLALLQAIAHKVRLNIMMISYYHDWQQARSSTCMSLLTSIASCL